ncbi:MAG TPA: plastocyanin/azurin family copper-binding protein [Gemmatimonadales bacterium]
MRKTWFGWALAAGAVLGGCGSPTGNGNGCASTGAVTVHAKDSHVFSPQILTITHGQSVCWQNDGSVTHSITPDSEVAADSAWAAYPEQTLEPNLPVLIQAFGSTGNYYYHCKFHGANMSGMYGVIQVR